MIEAVKRIIAYAAAVQIEKREPESVFSHDRQTRSQLRSDYDNDSSSHISGITGTAIFFHETDSRIDFHVEGTSFHGVDHASGHEFSGLIEAGEVMIRDDREGTEFRFRV